MPARKNVAVIGCGFFAQYHLHAWSQLSERANLVAVCDIDPAKAKETASKFGTPRWYDDPRALVAEPGLDLVDIVTRMETHKELVGVCLGAGLPTIVQKPFGVDLNEVRSMAAASRAPGAFLAVHENFRFQHPMRAIKTLIDQGAIGAPNWARISFRTGYDIYAGQPYLRSELRFVIIDLGVHVLDLARFFLGEVERITAETQRRNPAVAGEDTATMLLRHVSGAVSIVECTYESRRLPDPFPETLIEIEGSEGAMALRQGLKLELTRGGQVSEIDVDPPVPSWARGLGTSCKTASCQLALTCLRFWRQVTKRRRTRATMRRRSNSARPPMSRRTGERRSSFNLRLSKARLAPG